MVCDLIGVVTRSAQKHTARIPDAVVSIGEATDFNTTGFSASHVIDPHDFDYSTGAAELIIAANIAAAATWQYITSRSRHESTAQSSTWSMRTPARSLTLARGPELS